MKAARFIGCLAAGLVLGGSAQATRAVEPQIDRSRDAADGRAAFALLDRLPRLPGQFMVRQSSSRNKTGHNGDENWPLYKDERGDDVIFDAAGPGCVRSMWVTHIAEGAILNFYFDGEREPRYRIGEVEFFEGKHPAFPRPLNSYERRGRYAAGLAGNSFVPIPFQKSLKISITGESRFFHVIWEQYPYGTSVGTFTGREDRTALLHSFEPLADTPPPWAGPEIVRIASEDNQPGATVMLFSRKDAAGIVRNIVIEADGSEEMFRNSEIQMRWDGHTRADVLAPTGIFFACANHACDVESLPVSVQKLDSGRVRLTCRFPLPFWREAEILWRNNSEYSLGPVVAEVTVAANDLDEARSGYFTTLYREGKTSYGRDWRLLQTPGTGWFVGAVQTMQHGHYCEGDEHFYIDGAISPQINGTGSEDYYLGCFWPNFHYSSPFANCAGDIMLEAGGHFMGSYRIPACYSRFHLEAPIPFFTSIDARIQHGGLSYLRSDYRSLAYCYLRRRPAMRQTDFLDVGNSASEAAHDYRATRSDLIEAMTASPEGEYFEYRMDEDGRTHTGEITFTVAIDPDNGGVRLRRRLDQGSSRQAADVYVNGEYVGRWYHGNHNEHLRWSDSDFDIHSRHTREKGLLQVKLVVDTEGGGGPFTDFRYEVFCLDAGGGTRE
ncbi:MAG: DUF2961 domain-containing protein [Phycisphaerales bacterium]|nr:MAG: DUF2961 domain-containing protein [Phycisphaerales bacterium]